MKIKADKILEKSKWSVVGKLDDDSSFLIHVGYLGKNPVFTVADSIDLVDSNRVFLLDQILTFNPEGWEIDWQAIEKIQISQPQINGST